MNKWESILNLLRMEEISLVVAYEQAYSRFNARLEEFEQRDNKVGYVVAELLPRDDVRAEMVLSVEDASRRETRAFIIAFETMRSEECIEALEKQLETLRAIKERAERYGKEFYGDESVTSGR